MNAALQLFSFTLQMLSLLLNYGADITLCNNKGHSVLDLASDALRPTLLGNENDSILHGHNYYITVFQC